MTALSSLSSIRLLLAGAVLALVVAGGWGLAATESAAKGSGAIALAAAALLLAVLAGLRRHARLLDEIADIAAGCAAGQIDLRFNRRARAGDLAKLAVAMNDLLDLMEAFTKEASGAMTTASQGAYFRKILPSGLQGDFLDYAAKVNAALDAMDSKTRAFSSSAGEIGEDIQRVVQSVSGAAQQLSGESDALSQRVGAIAQQADHVREAAEQSTDALDGIAAATEEFAASIRDIGEQITGSAQLAENAVTRADIADRNIAELNAMADRVSKVIELITAIAEQTNLLALNATIEAARAGEAGKGFAVVASEVKNLAGQTAHAAEEVTAEIGQMQRLTQAAVDSVRDIHANIAEIDAGARHVAEAVQQQNHVVGDIGRQIEAAVARMRRIADIVREVADGTTESDHSVRSVRQAAEEMKRQSAGLDERVRHFVGKVLAVS